MRRVIIITVIIIISVLMAITISGQIKNAFEEDIPSLKEVFQKNFLIGSGDMREEKYFNERYFDFIKKHYNTLNINTFYPAAVHPREGVYKWNESDEVVEFAMKNKIRIRGHVLVWHKEGIGAQWMLKDKFGKPLERDEALKKMKEHIQSVVSRYKGKVWAWDVVNEAVDESEPDYIRNCMLKEVIGADYVEKAFIFAHEADTGAKLFYNDNNEWDPQKREAIHKFLKSLIEKKIPLHGIGMQMHISLNIPDISEIEKAVVLYSGLGIDIHITEMDIDMNPMGNLTMFTEDMKIKEAQRYKELFNLFKKYDKSIKAVYTYGIDDSVSWLKSDNGSQKENWPLLFDDNLKAKPAFWYLVK